MHLNFRFLFIGLLSLVIFSAPLNTVFAADKKPAATSQRKSKSKILDKKCVKYCGEGFFYDRRGEKNKHLERVCTKYPLDCGYSCTYGWDIRYLVEDTNFTCQKAKQRKKTITKNDTEIPDRNYQQLKDRFTKTWK